MKRLLLFILVTSVAFPFAAASQSLAEVAKKEEARRKVAKPTGKVYTNNELKTDITKTPPTAPAPATGTEPSTKVPSLNLPGGKAEEVEPAKDESWWRGRITTARQNLERNRIFADALQSRINALTTDIVNRADPAQRSQLELERQRALAELDRVKKEMTEQTKAITDIEDEARKAGVPPGWLR